MPESIDALRQRISDQIAASDERRTRANADIKQTAWLISVTRDTIARSKVILSSGTPEKIQRFGRAGAGDKN